MSNELEQENIYSQDERELFKYRPELGQLNDPRNFLALVHQHLKMLPPTPNQYDIMYNIWKGERRMLIKASRGIGKSHIACIFVCWALLIDKDLKIMVASASKDRANAFTVMVKRLISEMPLLQHLTPAGKCRDALDNFDVFGCNIEQSPSVKSVGIFGQIAGSRADIIIADDIEIPKNSFTQTMREKLLTAISEFDAVLKPGGKVLYLGTPQTEMSIYNQLPSKGYTPKVWPILYPSKLGIYRGELSDIIVKAWDETKVGLSTDPRFTQSDIDARRISYGLAGFELQFMLNTTLSDYEKYPLKLKDLIVTNIDRTIAPVSISYGSNDALVINNMINIGLEGDRLNKPMYVSSEFEPYNGIVMFIDPSGQGQDGTGYAVVGALNGMLYLLTAGSLFGSGYSDENLQTLALTAKTYKVNVVQIEKNFGGGMFTAMFSPVLNRIWNCAIEEVNASNQTYKERRICDVLEPVLLSHRLVVDPSFLENDYTKNLDKLEYSFQYQLTRITRDKGALGHDDTIEAVAYAVAYWVDILGLDVLNTEEKHQAELKSQQLRDFVESIQGKSIGGLGWIESEY